MIFTHKVETAYPNTTAPGRDAGGAQIELWSICAEMASRGLTSGEQSAQCVSDGQQGMICTRYFTSEEAAQEFAGHVHRLFAQVEHSSVIIPV